MTKPKSNAAAATTRRTRRSPSDDDVKMHVRLSRRDHAALAAEAERRRISLRELIAERTCGPASTERTRMPALIAELARHGEQVVAAALRAVWDADETRRLEAVCEAVRLVHGRAGGTAAGRASSGG